MVYFGGRDGPLMMRLLYSFFFGFFQHPEPAYSKFCVISILFYLRQL